MVVTIVIMLVLIVKKKTFTKTVDTVDVNHSDT